MQLKLSLMIFCYLNDRILGQSNVTTQQQSEETCRALDSMITGRSSMIGSCVRDLSCTMVTCVSTTSTNSMTILPCTNPISVHVVSNFGEGVNLVLVQNRTVILSSSSTAIIFLTQISGGIRFGLSQTTFFGLFTVQLLPITDIPLQCNLAITETSSRNRNGLITFECTAIGLPDIQFQSWETAFGNNATGVTVLTAEKRQDSAVIAAKLEVPDFATCRLDGGYVCIFDNGNSTNTVRSSILDCPEFVCEQGDLRLQGGDVRSGRVEVCNDNVWGTVCDKLWDDMDADVACRQLGFTKENSQATFTNFIDGVSSQPIWLNNVQCIGDELSLLDCSADSIGVQSCRHDQDAGVICSDRDSHGSGSEIGLADSTSEDLVSTTPSVESDGLSGIVVIIIVSTFVVILTGLMVFAISLTIYFKRKVKAANAVPVNTYDSVSYSTQIQPPLPAPRLPRIHQTQGLSELHAANDQLEPNFALMGNVAYRSRQEPAAENEDNGVRNQQESNDVNVETLNHVLRGTNRHERSIARPILTLTSNIAYHNGEDMENEMRGTNRHEGSIARPSFTLTSNIAYCNGEDMENEADMF